MAEVIVEILFVRHGFSCANAWKKRKGFYGFYLDPELTEGGIHLCRKRKPDLMNAIRQYFPGNSYKIGTSCLMRTQETAYYMLMEHTDLKYSIFPHIAEKGLGSNNSPMGWDAQKKALEKKIPHVGDRLHQDLRGKLTHKSNWSYFLKWITDLSEKDRETLFHKTEDGKYRAVVFTHGHFLRDNLHIKSVENNDIIYTQINATTQTIEEKHKLTEYTVPEDLHTADGCRIKKALDLLNPFLSRGTRRQRQRQRQRQTRRKPYSRR